MDLSLYEFDCQRALQHGLQYARRLNHGQLDVEHVALSMVQMALIGGFTPGQLEHIADLLSLQLQKSPRVLGLKGELAFGKRLDKALDRAEYRSKGSRVDTKVLWKCLAEQSTILQLAIQKVAKNQGEDHSSFQATSFDQIPRPPSPGPDAKDRDKAMKALEKYTFDLSTAAEEGQLDPIVGRDEEVRRVFEILGRKKKNNPILLGEPGVGKSAVAEAIALRIADGTVPDSIKTKRVLSLDLGLLVSGTKYRGDFEGRMKDILESLRTLRGQVILFIDEIHMVMGAGSTEGGVDAANMLKPALARGELHCIGATTFDEFRKHIEKDAALERRFQPLFIEEPSNATALAILRGLKSRYEIHHGVKIDDSALVASVELSSRYLASRRLPDKAIDLVDEAASRLRLEVESVPAVLDQLRAQIERFEIEKKAVGDDARFRSAVAKIDSQLAQVREEHNRVEAIWLKHKELLLRRSQIEQQRDQMKAALEKARTGCDYDLAAKLQYSDIPGTASSLQHIDANLLQMQEEHSFLRQVVGVADVAQVLSDWTGIPTNKFRATSGDEPNLAERISGRVFGQNHAIDVISKAIMRSRVGINDPKRPLGVFLFLGPTGVGKTELAKALTQELFHDESRLIRFDMSEYSEGHNAARLVGAPPGYAGFDNGGELTEALKRQPYSVVLLDEMDKAHGRINDLLLQSFDDGRLTDGRGRLVDLRHAMFIMTANISLDLSVVDSTDEALRSQLAQIWRPEFVNRIDEVVAFRELQPRHQQQILSRHLSELNDRLGERQMRVAVSPELSQFICEKAGSSEFGARAIRRLFQSLVMDQVTDRIISEPHLVEGAWVLSLDDDGEVCWSREFIQHYYLPPASSD